jgi:SAM-dependent methyltransferase
MIGRFESIKKLYREGFETYGDSPTSLLTPKGRNDLRFRAIDPFVKDRNKVTKILDYGCGLGYLYDYLSKHERRFDYTGYDFLPEFIDACAQKYPGGSFQKIDAQELMSGEFDVVFASGVFNLQTHEDTKQSKSYAFDRISDLFLLSQQVLVCDFLSGFVDFEQANSQHFSLGEIAEFCCRRLSRRFQIRHDLLPYEFTLIVWKDDLIKRPENIFEVDK